MGCVLVVALIAACVIGTHIGTHLLRGHLSERLRGLLHGLVYAEAAVAVVCLAGLRWTDPGVVPRARSTSLPLPRKVVDAWLAGEPLSGLTENIEEDGRTFCVRCFVWRERRRRRASCCGERACRLGRACPEGRAFHHCATCQRCVADFDHHCGVFGRCIAGKGLGGNMGYFKVIIAAGNLGGTTCVGSLLAGLSRTKYGFWVAVVVGGYFAIICCVSTCLFALRQIFFWQLAYRDSLRGVPHTTPAEGTEEHVRIIGTTSTE